MRLGLLYDLQTDPAQAEFDPPATIEALRAAFRELGHEVVDLGSARDVLARPERLRGVELVFNIGEGEGSRCREAWAPIVLDLLGLPYTGSDATALAVGLDKVMTKRVAAGCGVLTPPWIEAADVGCLPSALPFAWPAIVKPRYEGSGIGIDEGAIVHDADALRRRAAQVIAAGHGPVLIEQFVAHGELTICVIGNEAPETFVIQRPLDLATRLSCHVVRKPSTAWDAPLVLDETLEAAARHAAVTVFHALGCRDVARVDLRVDARGQVYFLEINPLPSFDPEGSVGLLAEHLGVPYAALLGRVLDAAVARLGHPVVAHRAVPS